MCRRSPFAHIVESVVGAGPDVYVDRNEGSAFSLSFLRRLTRASDMRFWLITHHPTLTLESSVALVGGAKHSEAVLEGADAGLDAPAPLEGSTEPALFLNLGSFFRGSSSSRQHHFLYTEIYGLAFIVCRKESAVSGRHLRRTSELFFVLLQRGHPLSLVRRIACGNFVVANNAVLHLINSHESSKLGRLPCFAFSDHGRMLLEQADDLVRMVTMAP